MTKLESLHVLTNLPISDLEEMFADELCDEQIRQDFEAGKFDKLIEEIKQEISKPL